MQAMEKDRPYGRFQGVDFRVNSDISVGQHGLHPGECVFRRGHSCLYFCVASGIWSYCEAQVFKDAETDILKKKNKAQYNYIVKVKTVI